MFKIFFKIPDANTTASHAIVPRENDVIKRVTSIESTSTAAQSVSPQRDAHQANSVSSSVSGERKAANCQVKAGVDILVTHTPPFSVGDCHKFQEDAGCPHLLRAVQERVKPKAHVFGHIHEPGMWADRNTTYVTRIVSSTNDLN